MDYLPVEGLRTPKRRHEGLLICTSAEYDFVILNDFVACLTLHQMQFPFRIVRIPNNFLYFYIKYYMFVKLEMSSICI